MLTNCWLKNQFLYAKIWLPIMLLVGMMCPSVHASCGDYLDHLHHPSWAALANTDTSAPSDEPVGRCHSGRCDDFPPVVSVESWRIEVTLVACVRYVDFNSKMDSLSECNLACIDLFLCDELLRPPIR